MTEKAVAPWSSDQVVALALRQVASGLHPYTCINSHEEGNELVPTPEGWVCLFCNYTQNWAHEADTKGTNGIRH